MEYGTITTSRYESQLNYVWNHNEITYGTITKLCMEP